MIKTILVTVDEMSKIGVEHNTMLDLNVILIDRREQFTDSASLIEDRTEDEIMEHLNVYRNAGYEDRNP